MAIIGDFTRFLRLVFFSKDSFVAVFPGISIFKHMVIKLGTLSRVSCFTRTRVHGSQALFLHAITQSGSEQSFDGNQNASFQERFFQRFP